MADKNVLLHNDSKDNIYPLTKIENISGLNDSLNKKENHQDTGWIKLNCINSKFSDWGSNYRIINGVLYLELKGLFSKFDVGGEFFKVFDKIPVHIDHEYTFIIGTNSMRLSTDGFITTSWYTHFGDSPVYCIQSIPLN